LPSITLSSDTVSLNDQYSEPKINLEAIVKSVEVNYFTTLASAAGSSVVTASTTLGDALKVDGNTLIGDAARATAVANWILAQRNNRAKFTIDWRGNQAQEMADVIAIDTTYGTPMNAYITKNNLKFEGYVQATTEAKGVAN
jgi:hypothetical protein